MAISSSAPRNVGVRARAFGSRRGRNRRPSTSRPTRSSWAASSRSRCLVLPSRVLRYAPPRSSRAPSSPDRWICSILASAAEQRNGPWAWSVATSSREAAPSGCARGSTVRGRALGVSLGPSGIEVPSGGGIFDSCGNPAGDALAGVPGREVWQGDQEDEADRHDDRHDDEHEAGSVHIPRLTPRRVNRRHAIWAIYPELGTIHPGRRMAAGICHTGSMLSTEVFTGSRAPASGTDAQRGWRAAARRRRQ
jgi:hypothetical protein